MKYEPRHMIEDEPLDPATVMVATVVGVMLLAILGILSAELVVTIGSLL